MWFLLSLQVRGKRLDMTAGVRTRRQLAAAGGEQWTQVPLGVKLLAACMDAMIMQPWAHAGCGTGGDDGDMDDELRMAMQYGMHGVGEGMYEDDDDDEYEEYEEISDDGEDEKAGAGTADQEAMAAIQAAASSHGRPSLNAASGGLSLAVSGMGLDAEGAAALEASLAGRASASPTLLHASGGTDASADEDNDARLHGGDPLYSVDVAVAIKQV